MDEKTFLDLADAELARLEARIEAAADAAGADIDVEPQPGGIVQLSFPNGSKIIINRHVAAREIWVAARSGGFHFRPLAGSWVDTRNGEELYAALARMLTEQAAVDIPLLPQ